MGWVHGNNGSSTTVSGGAVTFSLAVVAGDLIVAFGTRGDGGAQPICSDNVNGSYLAIVALVTDRPSNVVIFRKIATTTATITITVSATANLDCGHASNFSHTAGTIPGTANTSNSAAAPAATVNLTTTVNDTLVIGYSDASGANNAGTGMTVIAQTVSATRCTSEYQTALTNTAGTIAVANSGASPARGIIAAAFNPPVAGLILPSRFVRQAVNRASTY